MLALALRNSPMPALAAKGGERFRVVPPTDVGLDIGVRTNDDDG